MQIGTPSKLGFVLRKHIGVSLGALIGFAVIDCAIVGACVWAVRQNVVLRDQLARAVFMLTPEPGSIAPALAGTDWTGLYRMLSFQQDQRPTLVYTFNEDCPYCLQNWGAIRQLQRLAPTALRVAYIDTRDTLNSVYISDHKLERSLVIERLAPESALAYHAAMVPQAELLDRNGRVLWSHTGELTPAGIAKIESFAEKRK